MFKKSLLIAITIATSSSVAIAQPLVETLKPCINAEINGFRRPSVDRVEVVDQLAVDNGVYYELRARSSQFPWSFYVFEKNSQCTLISSGFAQPDLEMLDLPYKVAYAWSKKRIEKRINEVGREQIKKDIKAYTGQLQPYEIQAAQELGVWP